MSDEQSPARPKESNRVRELREELLLTRSELAARAGISLRTVWHVENGGGCRVRTKRKILRVLGVSKEQHKMVFNNG